jgi:GNAT superfamily N-acetyltransferase
MIRPMTAADVEASFDVQWAALSELDVRLGETTPEQTDAIRARGISRVAHLLSTDPAGAWVAEQDGAVVGCALAFVREGMWFLSLLMVQPGLQGKGFGRQLLDRTLTTSTDRSWILATSDPAALRRYQRAGFELHATYTAKGLPGSLSAPSGVTAGDYDRHADLVDHVARQVRGAGLVQDLPWLQGRPVPFLVVDDSDGRGFCFTRAGGVVTLGATTEHAARRLLTATLRANEGEIEVDWLSADQQWAIDLCLDARLSLVAGATVCLRGQPRMSPYLPSGAIG